MIMYACQPSVFSLKIAPLSALRKSMRIVRISKNCQVTAKKYTYRTTCTLHMHAHELQTSRSYCAGNSVVRKKRCKIRKNIARIRKTQTGGWQLWNNDYPCISSSYSFRDVLLYNMWGDNFNILENFVSRGFFWGRTQYMGTIFSCQRLLQL